MDNRKHESYEETHKKLVEAMQEACTHDSFDDYTPVEVDLSFMYADDEVTERKKKRFGFSSRFNKVAAIIVVILLTGNIVLLATDSNDSYGHKGLLHRLSETVTGIVTDNDNPVDGDEVVDHYSISSIDDIDKVIKKFPDLYVPGYIPEGYELQLLGAKIFKSGDKFITYNYYNGVSFLDINILYCRDAYKKIYYSDKIEAKEIDGKKIYVSYDLLNCRYSADLLYDNCIIEVTGLNSKDEVLKVIVNIKNAHK